MVEAGLGSLALHAALVAWLLTQPFGPRLSHEQFQFALRYRDPVQLVAPPPELIRELTGAPPSTREVNLEGLMAEPGPAPPPLPPAPAPAPPAPKPESPGAPEAEPETPPEPQIESPAEETPQVARADNLVAPGPGALTLPSGSPEPSRAKPAKPASPFEAVGSGGFYSGSGPTSNAGSGAMIPAPPSANVQDAIREVAQAGGGGQGMIIGDVQARGGVFEARSMPPSRGDKGSSVQLLSDPKGVDFRPYLIRVLASVRRNWFAVMPASVRLGRRGRTAIQFSIDLRGNVPKLVIAVPSGSDSLDRAAVAGISASNPFPPLPAEFTGEEIRLQLNFLYNMKK